MTPHYNHLVLQVHNFKLEYIHPNTVHVKLSSAKSILLHSAISPRVITQTNICILPLLSLSEFHPQARKFGGSKESIVSQLISQVLALMNH